MIECDESPSMVRSFKLCRGTIRPAGALDERVIELVNLTVWSKGADSKKSRSCVMVKCGGTSWRLTTRRFSRFFQGKFVITPDRCSSYSEERSPSKSAISSIG